MSGEVLGDEIYNTTETFFDSAEVGVSADSIFSWARRSWDGEWGLFLKGSCLFASNGFNERTTRNRTLGTVVSWCRGDGGDNGVAGDWYIYRRFICAINRYLGWFLTWIHN
jgi:hypothetical protein